MMLAQKLRVEDVLALEHEMLAHLEFWPYGGRDADKLLVKIEGIHETIQAVINEIKKREDS